MPFSPTTYEEKPYNRCIDCVHIGKKCDGPDFLAMEIPRLCEWSRMRKDYLHRKDAKWTNAYIAERADVSKTTVDRFFVGDIEDLKFSTAARIIKVLVNGTWGQYPCSMAANEDNSKTESEFERLRELLSEEKAKTAYLKDQVAFKEEQMRLKDQQIADRGKLLDERRDFLHRKDRVIVILAVLLGVCVLSILGLFWLG